MLYSMSMLLRFGIGITLVIIAIYSALFLWFAAVHPVLENGQSAPGMTGAQDIDPPFGTALLNRLGLLPSRTSAISLVGVVVENHVDARAHQQGLEKALLVEEWPVEGGISRFLLLFNRADLPEEVGPVRSLRPAFIEGGTPWTSIFVRAGGSPEAESLLLEHPEITDINGLHSTSHDLFFRKNTIPAPHNLFMGHKELENIVKSNESPTVQWPPFPTGKVKDTPMANDITIDFYSNEHLAHYTYQPNKQLYLRSNGAALRQAETANVLVLEVPIRAVGELGRLTIPLQGSGRATLFQAGTVQEGTWTKESFESALSMNNTDGEPLIFQKGTIWMTVVPSLQRLEWKQTEEEN